MTDRLTPEQRRRCMQHIRSKDTSPELKVRQWLWRHNYRYRLNVKNIPGTPDIVMRKYKTAIFVNGCFWHGHGIRFDLRNGVLEVDDSPCCKMPKSNSEFWIDKIRHNKERDCINYKKLHDNGWQVIVLWECRLKPACFEETMRKVEARLHSYFVSTFDNHSRKYIKIDTDSAPVAAEDSAPYYTGSWREL